MSDTAEQIRSLVRQVESNEAQVKDLLRERDSLDDFFRQVTSQRGDFEGKVRRRSQLATRAAQIPNVRIAQVIARRTQEYTCTTMANQVEGVFADALDDARRAVGDIDGELDGLREQNQWLRARIRELQERLRAEQEQQQG